MTTDIVDRLRALRGPWIGDGISPAINAYELADQIEQMASTIDALKLALIQSKDELIDEKIKNLGDPNASTDPNLEALAEIALRRRPYYLQAAEQQAMNSVLKRSVRFLDSEPEQAASGLQPERSDRMDKD